MKDREIANKVLNSAKEYLRFVDNLLKEGLIFEKKVAKFSNTSAAVYLPKRLIGRTFKIYLMPVDDGYELSEMTKKEDKLIKDTEKEVEKIQKERVNLLEVKE